MSGRDRGGERFDAKVPRRDDEPGEVGPASHNELGGVAKGPVVQARTIHGDVYFDTRQDRPGVPPPRQLPPVPANFTGRSAEMDVLEQFAFTSDTARRLAIVVIVGSGGIGKTSLASYWLHRISHHYEDGALFADLGGQFPADAVPPSAVLPAFLRALGIAPELVPLAIGEQAALFRSATSGRRLAILLDNAGSAAQVRALLPGPGPASESARERYRPSLVVVTTRWRITGLATEGAKFLDLDPLDEPAAQDLLVRMIGDERIPGRTDDIRRLVRLCAGMPLALCVIGARLAAHPRWPLSRVVADLDNEHGRLTVLSLTGDLSVRAAFDTSHKVLAPEVARAYHAAALIPGPDFESLLAAAALNENEERARDLLDVLVDASLLSETDLGRYRFHDLARLHARELANSDPAVNQRDIISRCVMWYLREAVAADLVVLPGRWRVGSHYEQVRALPPAYDSPPQALTWLESHLDGLLAVLRAASAMEHHREAWQLCEAMWGLMLFRKYYDVSIRFHDIGLASARACADQRAEAQMHIQLGSTHRSLGHLDVAADHFGRALELFRAEVHRLGEASALDQLGVVELRLARYDAAIAYFEQARAIHQEIGRPRGVALMNFNIGQALIVAGHPREAVDYLRTAVHQFQAIGERYHRARTLSALAEAFIHAGQLESADAPLREAMTITQGIGATYDRAHIHVRLADLADASGQPDQARDHLEQALSLFMQVEAPHAAQVRARLDQAGAP